MRLCASLIFAGVLGFAQSPGQNQASRGLDIFNKSCATGYCHGVNGTAGGAPRLAGRGFDDAYITKTVRSGIAGTGMPALCNLDSADFLAVVAYVDSLNGITSAVNPEVEARPFRPKPSLNAQHGRELFADQARGLTRCSNCHQADGIGIAVTLPLSSIPPSVVALRQIATPGVESATAEGDTFPALVLNRDGVQTKLYDLTIPPPVLRTFVKGTAIFKPGSKWRHDTMLAPYNDQELESILAFLRAMHE